VQTEPTHQTVNTKGEQYTLITETWPKKGHTG